MADYIVKMEIFSFDSLDEANKFREFMEDLFCSLDETTELGCVLRTHVVEDDDL